MKVVGKHLINSFASHHNDSRAQLSTWVFEAEEADWSTPSDIKLRYPNASYLSNNHVIFNIKGNRYRLYAKIAYKQKIVTIVRIGTHEEYTKWNLG